MKQTLYQNPLTDQYDGGSCPSVAAKEEHLRQIGHDESITSPRAGSKAVTIKLWVTSMYIHWHKNIIGQIRLVISISESREARPSILVAAVAVGQRRRRP